MHVSRVIGRAALGAAALAAAVAYTRRNVRDIERSHPPIGRFVTTRSGVRLHYIRRGKGRSVILLHGATSQLQDMTSSLLPALADRHEVFAFDRPGHGYSQGLPERGQVMAQARALHDAAQLLRIERPVVVGHGIGAAVALAYGMLFPREVSGAVFLSGPGYAQASSGLRAFAGPAMPFVGGVLAHTVYRVIQPKLIASRMRQLFAPREIPSRLLRELPMEMLCRPQAIVAQADDDTRAVASLAALRAQYSRFPLPVAIFAGMEDRHIDPGEHAIPLSRELPRSDLHLLPGLGHMVHHFVADEIAGVVDSMQS